MERICFKVLTLSERSHFHNSRLWPHPTIVKFLVVDRSDNLSAMNKIFVLVLSVIGVMNAFGGERFDAKAWQAVEEFNPPTLQKSLGAHVGQLVGVRINFRGKDIHHLKPNWYEGSIWGPNPEKSGKFINVRVMVSKKDLPAFKAITTDATSAGTMVVYGKVARDADANFFFVRLIGRKAIVDPAGNATVDW